MFSRNFYYRIKYQLEKKAPLRVFLYFFLDRILHPFTKSQKKLHRNLHRNFLKKKQTTTDYFSINAYYWNYIIKENFKNFSYMEIGSYEGNSVSYILKNFSPKKVYCVDVWEKDKNYKGINKQNFDNFKFNMKEFEGRFSFFKEGSDNFFQKNSDYFDIIYVDGTHESHQVHKDINNAWNFLNLNGIMICDDYFYGNLYTGLDEDVPATAINKFLKKKKNELKIICINNNQIFIKKILD